MQDHNRRVLIFFAVIVILMAIVLPVVYVNQEKIEQRKKTEQAYTSYSDLRTFGLQPQDFTPATEVTVSAVTPSTGTVPGGIQLTLTGAGFLSGDRVYFFMDSEKGDDLLKVVPTVSVTSNEATFVTPRLGSGVYTVGIDRQGTRSAGVSYTVHYEVPTPEIVSKESTGASWDEKAGDTYENPRLYTATWKGELAPADTIPSATEWCRLIPYKGYTSGTPYVYGGYAENYKYAFDGSKWVRLIQGDYVRQIACK